jgi:hypothetical protein
MTSRTSVRPKEGFLRDQYDRAYQQVDFTIKGEKRKEQIPVSDEKAVIVLSN